LTAKVPHGRWKTMTFLAALRHDRIDAPWSIEGPIDGESFRTYVEKAVLEDRTDRGNRARLDQDAASAGRIDARQRWAICTATSTLALSFGRLGLAARIAVA
jgi:hypothetical protein